MIFWKPPRTLRSRSIVEETFRVYDGSIGMSVLDCGVLAEVLRHPDLGKPVSWHPPAPKSWQWGEGTQSYEMAGITPMQRKA